MKFLCPSCKAKYQIADEKVAGRAVRMKCRKCGYIIPLSQVPPAPPSMLPGAFGGLPEVPKAPPPPVVATPSPRTPPSPATQASKSPVPPSAASRSPVPGAARSPSPPPAGSKSPLPPSAEKKSSPLAAKQPVTASLPRPTLSQLKGPPPKPPGSRPTAPEPSAPAAAPAPPPKSSPVAAAHPAVAPAPTPAKAAAPLAGGPMSSLDLLSALDEGEEEGDGVTRIAPGGALAEAFGAHVSGSYQAPTAAALHLTADEWFVGINDVPVGPIRLNELRKRAMLGAVTPESLVWREGIEAWRPLKTFPELVAVLEEGMSSVKASLTPLPPAGKPLSESDPFGSGLSPGGITGPVVVSEDIAVAGLARTRTPLAAWIAMGIAVAFGVVIGFVAFSKQKPPETIVKYVEVHPDGGVTPVAAAVAEDTPSEAPGAASAKVGNKRPSGSTKKSTDGSEKEGSNLTGGLKGLSGLSASGPGGPGASSPGATPAGGGAQLEGSQIQSTVAKYTGSVKRSCWQPALDSRDPNAPTSARVMVTITVGSSGSVQNVTTSGEPRGYPGLASCIAGRVRGWQFPASGGTTTANVPFVFAAQ